MTPARPLPTSPLVVSYGVGVDSTAMLIEMHRRGIRPDLILTADTGGEKPETYAYLWVIQPWLESVGFPSVTIVRTVPTRAVDPITHEPKYRTLEENMLVNETLPAIAFGGHTCSLRWKAAPQEKFLNHWPPALECWARSAPIVRAIGYDNGARDQVRSAKAAGKVVMAIGLDASPRDAARAAKAQRARTFKAVPNAKFDYWYPLQEWGIDRDACEAVIVAAGLPVPMKSACWFCTASHKSEIEWLQDTHPDLAARAVAMEENARTGKHGLRTTKGLGRRFSWKDFLEARAARLVRGEPDPPEASPTERRHLAALKAVATRRANLRK